MQQVKYSIGVDIGGTFTDAAVIDQSGKVYVGKADTTPRDITQGVVGALEVAAEQIGTSVTDMLGSTVFFSHGTTVGTNALITRSGEKTGILVTKGFEDTPFMQRSVGRLAGLSEIEIKNQVALRQPRFIVPKDYVKGVTERIDCLGKVVVPLDEAEARQEIMSLLDNGVRSIGICLLWSFANDDHEHKLDELVHGFDQSILTTCSSDLIPKIRENARLNSTAINSYVGGTVTNYLNTLTARLRSLGLSCRINIMQVFGGLSDIESVKPIYTIDSGPVGGVIGSQNIARYIGRKNLITSDVGGTSFDVSTIYDGKLQLAREYFGATGVIDRFEVLIPRVDIKVIGAGGGSIARFDPISETIRLGPESAGADPGPVFYDLGGVEPTLADAWLVLGYLNEDNFLGGRKKINKNKAFEVIEDALARPMNMTAYEVASGIKRIADNSMADTIRERLAEKGYDHREFSVLAYGGAGSLHAASYGRLLGVKDVILARNASVFSALGIALSDITHTFGRSVLMQPPFDARRLRKEVEVIRKRLQNDLEPYQDFVSGQEYSVAIEMKYRGQIHEISIPVSEELLRQDNVDDLLTELFSRRYEAIYGKGSGYEKGGIEIVGINGTAIGKIERLSFATKYGQNTHYEAEPKVFRSVYMNGGQREVPVYEGESLRPGARFQGPAIVEYLDTTALILDKQSAEVDGLTNIIIREM